MLVHSTLYSITTSVTAAYNHVAKAMHSRIFLRIYRHHRRTQDTILCVQIFIFKVISCNPISLADSSRNYLIYYCASRPLTLGDIITSSGREFHARLLLQKSCFFLCLDEMVEPTKFK